MADFVAILKKTIGSLGDNTPELREKVYDKARMTIEAKLAAIDPPPPTIVVERQRKALEDAIAAVRAEYDTLAEDDHDPELESLLSSIEHGTELPPLPSVTPPPQPAAFAPFRSAEGPAAPPPPTQESLAEAAPGSLPPPALPEPDHVEPVYPEPEFVGAALPPAPSAEPARKPTRPRGRAGGSRRVVTGVLAAALALVVFGGAGYAVWLNRADFAGLFSAAGPSTPAPVAVAPEPSAEAAADATVDVAEDAPTVAEAAADPAPQEVEEEVAALAPEPQRRAEPQKFTQRLMPDGSEVDEGPADGPQRIGEGTSLAAVVAPDQPQTATDAGDAETASADEPDAPAVQTSTPTIPVGQRAIFYEERTSLAEGSAELGSIVWTLVQESPGGDLPPEPAVRAEVTIPGRDLQLRMTIRRNGDDTLPAGHIIEMIFLTPDGFEGGGIANVSRVAFKESEQAAGNPLLGIPAKIADGFFLVALSDNAPEMEANVTLMRRQSWIDIPLLYQSGRRALVTLEKGVPGDRVFQEALRAWTEASSG